MWARTILHAQKIHPSSIGHLAEVAPGMQKRSTELGPALHMGQQHINQIKRLLSLHVFHATSVWKYFLHRATLSVQSACGGARHQWESCLGGDVLLTRRQQSRLQMTKLSEHKQTYSIHNASCSYLESTGSYNGDIDDTGQNILIARRKKISWL